MGIPQSIGKYEIEGIAGEGSQAVVYKGYNPDLPGMAVAIKTARQEGVVAGETWRLAALSGHPAIAHVMDAGTHNGHAYIVSRFVDGETLEEWLGNERQIDWRQAATLVLRLADALAFAHAKGFVHRDVRPRNILVEAKEHELKPVLIDWGLARHQDETWETHFVGSPPYHAPERVDRPDLPNHRSDIYSLGSVLYELLAGKPPYADSDVLRLQTTDPPASEEQIVEAAERMHEEDLVPVGEMQPSAPASLVGICERAMETSVERRYQSAGEMAHDLQAYVAGRLRSRRALLAACAGGAAAGLLGAALPLYLWGKSHPDVSRDNSDRARVGLIAPGQLKDVWEVRRPNVTQEFTPKPDEPIADPTVTLENDTMRLINRGYAVSRNEWRNGAVFEADWKWKDGDKEYCDHLTVVFRTNAEPKRKWPHEITEGLMVKFNPRYHCVEILHVRKGMRLLGERLGICRNLRISRDAWHRIKITDDRVTISAYFGDSKAPVVSAPVPNDAPKYHRIAIYNREAVGRQNKESLLKDIALATPTRS